MGLTCSGITSGGHVGCALRDSFLGETKQAFCVNAVYVLYFSLWREKALIESLSGLRPYKQSNSRHLMRRLADALETDNL